MIDGGGQHPHTPEARASRQGILIAEDEEGLAAILKMALVGEGFVVHLAAHGQEALELYQRLDHEIALVLLDVRMPCLDGPQTLAALRRLDPHLSCWLMTAHIPPWTRKALLALGADHVLAKPFDLDEVLDLIGRWTQRRALCPRAPDELPRATAPSVVRPQT